MASAGTLWYAWRSQGALCWKNGDKVCSSSGCCRWLGSSMPAPACSQPLLRQLQGIFCVLSPRHPLCLFAQHRWKPVSWPPSARLCHPFPPIPLEVRSDEQSVPGLAIEAGCDVGGPTPPPHSNLASPPGRGQRCPNLSRSGAAECLSPSPGWGTGQGKPQGDLTPPDLGVSLRRALSRFQLCGKGRWS